MQNLPDLPPVIAREIFASLCSLLPPPATDTQEARADAARYPGRCLQGATRRPGLPPGLTRA
jgi:hypothetical protein